MRTYLKYKDEAKSISDVASAIKTIKKISAIKLKKQKNIFERNADFVKELSILISHLGEAFDKQKFSYPINKNSHELMIVITGNKGLVGSLYQDVSEIAENESRGKMIVTIGLKSEGISGNKFLSFELPDDPKNSPGVSELLTKTITLVKNGSISNITIVYPSFNGFTDQKSIILPLYPINFTKNEDSPKMLITEPGKYEVLASLADLYIKTNILKAISEAVLSEVSARLVNSQKADDKSQILLNEGIKNYLKARRVDITRQQLEGFIGHIL